MAWTSPRTWTVGETVTAAEMNAHVRDNTLALAGVRGIIPSAGTTATAGTGFTYTHAATGLYVFTLTTPFAAAPVVVAAPLSSNVYCNITAVTTSGFTIGWALTATSAASDVAFNFLASQVI